MNGGDAVAEALIALGVDTGFTVPGESFLSILEALRVRRNAFRLLSTRHESGATFAAGAYGRLAARPAAVLVSRGPGASNAAIGIHDARQGSVPLVLLVGHVRRRSKGREAFQEIDHHRMFAPVAKAVLEPEAPGDLADVVAEAVGLSMAGRPGPVVVVLPRDVTEAAWEGSRPSTRPSPARLAPRKKDLDAATDAIDRAAYPLVIAGEMVTYEAAGDELVAFVEALGAPVMSAYRQQDAFPNGHPAYAGHLEINRAGFQREALARADLVLAVGTRLDGITTEDYALLDAGKPLLQIYPDEGVLERCAPAVAVHGHVGPVLSALSPRLKTPNGHVGPWRNALHESYLALTASERGDARGALNMAAVVETISRTVPGDTTVVTDGGSFARWVHRYRRFSLPRTFAGPVSGAMGYAVPGALGAALARPGAPVLAFVGDGGFMMTGQELTTARAESLNVKIVVCDNQAHGSILYAQWQRFDRASDYATRLASPDFVAVAEAYGVPAWRVARTEEFPAAFAAALERDGPALLHLLTDQRDIVPSGPEDDVV